MSKIIITSDGTNTITQTIASDGYQFFASGNWNGATITINIQGDNNSTPIIIGTLSSTNQFIEKIEIMQGIYISYTVSGSQIGTNINLFSSPLNVYYRN